MKSPTSKCGKRFSPTDTNDNLHASSSHGPRYLVIEAYDFPSGRHPGRVAKAPAGLLLLERLVEDDDQADDLVVPDGEVVGQD